MSGYVECGCCGEVIMGQRGDLCECCTRAECTPACGCNVPQCPECETPASFLNDAQWHSNCDSACPNAGKVWS